MLLCWKSRFDKEFRLQREYRVAELKSQVAPLKKERLELLKAINQLTFDVAISQEDTTKTLEQELNQAQRRLAEEKKIIAPLQNEIDQLSRQFWVRKDRVQRNKYDLSASRYRMIEADEAYFGSRR